MDLNYKERYKKILEDIFNVKSKVIFGAGHNGGILKEVLDYLEIKCDFFLVNNGHKRNDYYKGAPVYELAEVENIDLEEFNVLNAIQSSNPKVLFDLRKKTSKILLLNNKELWCDLFTVYYEKYFKENNINISKEIIEFNNIKFINPFLLERDYLDAFLREIGDLIKPIFNDYNNICEGPYEHGMVSLSEGDIVIDCGSNIGVFSAIAASKKCICYAFEPMPKARKYLKNTADLYKDLIKISEYALGNSKEKVKFYIGNGITDCSILESNESMQSQGSYIEVSMITLDEFVKQNKLDRVDFIKADIEGAERDLLMGAKETLAKFAPKISICTYHLEDDPEVLENLIREANPNYIIEHKWKKLYAYVQK